MDSLFDDIEPNSRREKKILPEKFAHLDEVEQLILALVAVLGKVDGKSNLYDMVRYTMREMGMSAALMKTQKQAKAYVDHLLNIGVLKSHNNRFIIPFLSRRGLPQQALSNDLFKKAIAKTLRRHIREDWTMPVEIARYCFLTQSAVFDKYRISLSGYRNQSTELYTLVLEQEDLSLLNYDFLASIDSEQAGPVIEQALFYLPPSDLISESAVEWFDSLGQHQYFVVYALLSYLSLCGTPFQIEQVVKCFSASQTKHKEGIESLIFLASFLRGDLGKARQQADRFKLYWAEVTGSKRKYMPFDIGVFYAILLWIDDKKKDRKDALTYLRAAIKSYKERYLIEAMGYELAELLLSYFTTKQNGGVFSAEGSYFNPSFIRIWRDILMAWEGQLLDHRNSDDWQENKRFLLESKAFDLKLNGDADNDSKEIVNQLSKELDISPLVNLQEPRPEWEELLDLFEEQAGKNKKEGAAAIEERLLWRVSVDHEEIQPYYQKMTRKGWSKGRNVALRTLFSKTPMYADPTDIQIINNLKKHDGWYGVEYHWNFDKCLPHFVNNPKVFTYTDPMLPLVIEKKEVGFVVKESKETIRVSLSDNIEQGIVKEGTNHYKFLVVEKDIAQTAKLIFSRKVDALEFPKKEKERVMKALTSYSQRIAVTGDFDDPNLIKKKAKTAVFVRLQPAAQDLNVAILVRPLRGEAITFIPGKGNATVQVRTKDNKRIQLKRSLSSETKSLQAIVGKVPTFSGLSGNELWLEDQIDILNLLAELREFAPDVLVEWPKGEQFKVSKVASVSDFNINVKSGVDWFDVDANITIDDKKVWTLQQLLEASGQGTKTFVKLDGNTFVKLQKQLQKRITELSAIATQSKEGLQVHKLGLDVLSRSVEEAGQATTDKEWKKALKVRDEFKNFAPKLPGNLVAELRPYQVEGYNWLSRLHAMGAGACLADDMGLGKTIQAIALMAKYAANGPCLVVAPSSVCPNWLREISVFCPALHTQQLGIKGRAKLLKDLKAFDVLIVSYGILQSNPDLLAKKKWNITVLDEAHAIKNKESQRSKAVMKLNAKFKLALTGTPIQNHIGELWNLFQFLNPGFLGTYDSFNERFNSGHSDEQDRQRKALNSYISPFILRRKKSDVLDDLPEKTEITLTIEQSEEEKALYELLRQKAVAEIESGENENVAMQILAQISKLRMASCNPHLVEGGTQLKSTKLHALANLVDDLLESNHKALIFSQFTKHLSLIKQMLDEKGISYQYLDGSSSSKARESAIHNFQSGESELFLISLKAGGVGLNLTAADYVIHMDPWWNPAIEDQASDRAHRIGQTRPVTVYRMVAEGTIEEKIVKLHHSKRDLADQLLADTDRSAKISSEALFELMK